MIIHLSDLNKVPIGVCNYLFAGEKKKNRPLCRYVAGSRSACRPAPAPAGGFPMRGGSERKLLKNRPLRQGSLRAWRDKSPAGDMFAAFVMLFQCNRFNYCSI